MKLPIRLLPILFAFFAVAGMQNLPGQTIPANPVSPNKLTKRDIGDTGAGLGAAGFNRPKPQTAVRTVTHIVLGTARQWQGSDGRPFLGKLIAFEDIISEAKPENTANPVPAAPVVPAKPTVVRDGKARLWVNAKVYEVALDRLAEEDRKFVESIRDGIAAKK